MRRLLPLALLLVFAAPAGAATPSSFYTPPSHLPGKTHGDVIRSRTLTGSAALKSAGSNRVVLYSSVGIDGKPVAVSGTISLPKGKAPKGGWPVVTWAHGTTGLADRCAPSRAGSDPLVSYAYPLLN